MPCALVVGVHRDRAQRDRGPLPHRRAAADEVPDDLTVQVGDEGQGVEDVALGAQPVAGSGVSSECSAPVGHAERQVVQGTGWAPRSPGRSRRRTRSRFTASSCQRRRRRARASTARSGSARPSRSTSTTSSATSSPSPATSRRAAAGRAPRARTTPRAGRRGAAPSALPRQPAGAYSGALEACTRKSGPLSTSRSTTSHGPRGAAAPASTSSTSATCSVHRSPSRPASSGDQPGAGPADQRRGELDDVGVPHPRVREHGAGRHPQAEPADEHPPRRRVPRAGRARRGRPRCWCRRCPSRRRRRRRARAPRRGGAAPPRRAGCRRARGSPPRRGSGGRRHAARMPVTPPLYGRERAGRPVENHRRTRPFVRSERPSEAVEPQLAVVEADGLTRAGTEGGVVVLVVARHRVHRGLGLLGRLHRDVAVAGQTRAGRDELAEDDVLLEARAAGRTCPPSRPR